MVQANIDTANGNHAKKQKNRLPKTEIDVSLLPFKARINKLPSWFFVVPVATIANGQGALALSSGLEDLLSLGELLFSPVDGEYPVILSLDHTQVAAGQEPAKIAHISQIQHSRNIIAVAMRHRQDTFLVGRE